MNLTEIEIITMKKLFMISTMLFNWLLIPSVHAIYDVVAIDIIPQGDQVKFCLDLDTHDERKTKFYVAALVGNKVIFIEPTSNGHFTPYDFATNSKPPPFSQWNKSANALCLTPLPKIVLQGIDLYAAVGASLNSIMKKESYRRIFNGFPTLPQSSQDWTVMVYMVGSDLEHNSKRCIREQNSNTCKRAASTDILEMLEGSTQPSSTSLVVSTGGSMRTGWQTVKRSLIQNGQLSVLEDIGAQDMAAPNTLSEFVLWAKTNFPAQNYALILWSHGKATQGIGPDSNSEKMMTLPELSKAYQDIKAQSGTLDIVIYDAC